MTTGFQLDLRQNSLDGSPLYMQVARGIERAIADGRFLPDAALPSERALSESLKVSRVTARAAIDLLVTQGLIVRRRGSGNFIAPRVEHGLMQLSSFSEELKKRGYLPSSRWLNRSLSTATTEERLTLGLSGATQVARLERLRLADGHVMAYEISSLPATALPDPLAVGDSLYETLEKMDRVPVRALQHIRAMSATVKLAAQLEVTERDAVLFITRIGYLGSGQAIELTHSYCRSDYYDFVVEMRREP